MSVVWLKKQDLIYDMLGFQGIRDPFDTLFTILTLSAIRQMKLFWEPESLGWLKEQLILEHNITELRLSLQKFEKFIEWDDSVALCIQFFDYMIPGFLTLHNTLAQFSE